ncbi:MAG: hypothetical protein GY851_18890 [bacterium]|nr:hypothetical protein [bacterium]
MRRNRSHQEGVALMIALFALMLILGAVAVVVHRAHVTKRHTDSAILQTELDEACKAGIDVAIERVWNQYVTGNGNTTGNLASYRVFIDDLVDTNEDTNGSGGQDGGEWDADGSGAFDMSDPAYLVNPTDNSPIILPSGSRISTLSVERFDDLTGTTMTIQATGEKGGVTRTLTQTVRVAGELFQGFEFGIMANNINCILCHAEFMSLDLERDKTNPDGYNTFDRIKVAALESLLIRTGEAESNVAGTVYTRGRVYDKNGNEISASGVASSSFNGYQFSSDNGKLIQNTSGNLSETDMVNAGTDGDGRPNQFANLYLDYPSDETQMTDGNLPESFPAPIPDDDGDRCVSDLEFERVMNSSNGSVHFELDPNEDGSIQGGVAYGVADGSAYVGDALPTSSNDALVDLANDGYYDGNLILVGNENDPIVIDKRVAVDGDVIIKGPIKGWGQLYVRGNAYIVGDVTYADGAGEFGVADDGTENGFALTTGGSIMIGDYTTNRAKNNWKNGSPDYVDPYVWQGKFIRMDHEHYEQTMSNGEKTEVGYFDDGAADAGWGVGDEGMYSFTTSELMLFNRMEHLKAEADPSYTPRYYQLRDTAPVYEYITEDVTNSSLLEHAVNYFCPGVEVISDTTGAAVHSLNPKNYWMSEDQLRHFWWDDERAREAKGGRQPWRFDGLLYSNNSIFSVIRSNGRHKSRCYGTFEIRGSIVCADLGVLMIDSSDKANTGLRLYYDKRVADFLRVEDTTQVEFRRIAMRY